METNSTSRFSNRVDNYVKYRPHYPKQIITYLNEKINFNQSFIVADIGSGTGISTELFLQNKNKTYAVEPNTAMRLKAEQLFGNDKNFISINATAEQTSLADNSIDLIIAGQAFHWFDAAKTKKEFARITNQNAHVILIWNERQVKSDFEKEYENLLLQYATDYASIDHKNITPEKINHFFSPQPVDIAVFDNEQIFDFEGLKGRLLSSSYIPAEENTSYHQMIDELFQLYKKYEAENKVVFAYETKLFIGKIK